MSSSARWDNLIHDADIMSWFLGSIGSLIDKVRQSNSFAQYIVSWSFGTIEIGRHNDIRV